MAHGKVPVVAPFPELLPASALTAPAMEEGMGAAHMWIEQGMSGRSATAVGEGTQG